MVAKAVLFVCAQALLLQSISGCGCGWGAANWGAAPYAAGWGGCGAGIAVPASSGGGLPIASASPYAPTGIAVQSENSYCGELAVRGALPFLGTVGLAGELPTAGAAAVNYGCGNGAIGMVTEDIGAAGAIGYGGLGYGIGPGVGYGIGGGCGCGGLW